MPSSSLRHVLDEMSAHVRALRAHEAGARAGRDPEHLHEMRVAVRRLRAILRASRALFDPAWVDRLRDELDWLGGRLGLVRDLDVLHAYHVVEHVDDFLAAMKEIWRVLKHGGVAHIKAPHMAAYGAKAKELIASRVIHVVEKA